jgi:hypothetical protein
MMQIRRVVTWAVAVAMLAGAPALIAQNNQQPNRRDQERRSQADQKDIQALVQSVDAVASGKQPAPADIPLRWEGNHFLRGGDGSTYIPFTIVADASKLASPPAALYIRVVDKNAPQPAAPAAEQNNSNRNRNQQPQAAVTYPWDNVNFIEVKGDGKLARAIALKPGEYEMFITMKERSPLEQPRNAPPAKMGMLRHEITVPDFGGAEITTSSILLGSVEQIATPLTPEQQQENPYTFGNMKVVPSSDSKLKKSGELQVLFWVYGTQANAGKPDVQIEYNFHQKTPEGEKYFNKTAPQLLNASTLPPQFDVAAGHQLPGSLVVPLASFPVGDYRLEIKVTDKISGKAFTQNVNFTVEA